MRGATTYIARHAQLRPLEKSIQLKVRTVQGIAGPTTKTTLTKTHIYWATFVAPPGNRGMWDVGCGMAGGQSK